MFKNILISLGFFLIITGCQDKGLNLRITFDQVEGLTAGNRLIFDQNHIGRVTDVRYEESGSFMVRVAIERAFAQAVTEHARFFIVTDPMDQSKKAIEMIHTKKGGKPLEDGAAVKGSDKYSALFDRTRESFEKELEGLEKQIEKLSDQFKSIPESDAYKNLKKELEQLSDKLKSTGEAAHEKIEKELLPRLKEELDKLRERLFELQKEEEDEGPVSV